MAEYAIQEHVFLPGQSVFIVLRDGGAMSDSALGTVNNFKTLEAAVAAVERLKFKPYRKIVWEDEF